MGQLYIVLAIIGMWAGQLAVFLGFLDMPYWQVVVAANLAVFGMFIFDHIRGV